jgi:hypothetical protein
LALAASGAALFAAVAMTNLIIDPQFAFGTGLIPSPFTNDRLTRFAAYQAAADSYDSLLFGSSRGRLISRDELGNRTNARVADFTIGGGMMSDHLPVLEFVVRQKASRKRKLKAVLLLLDIDNFGTPPITNLYNSTLLPPELTGESRVRFWWRHLTWIQFRTWRYAIEYAQRAWRSPETSPTRSSWQPGRLTSWAIIGTAQAQVLGYTAQPADPLLTYKPIRERADFDAELKLLQRFAALCRDNGVMLMVALSPLHRTNQGLSDPDLRHAIDRVSSIVPLWDFTAVPDLPPDLPRYWFADRSHFTAEVGQLMLRRIFGEELPEDWRHFGRRKG